MSSDSELSDSGTAKGYTEEFSGLAVGSSPSKIKCYEQNKDPIKERLVKSMVGQESGCTDDDARYLADIAMETLTHDECVTRSGAIMHRFTSEELEYAGGRWLTAVVYLGYNMAFDAEMQIDIKIPDLVRANGPNKYPVNATKQGYYIDGIVEDFDWP